MLLGKLAKLEHEQEINFPSSLEKRISKVPVLSFSHLPTYFAKILSCSKDLDLLVQLFPVFPPCKKVILSPSVLHDGEYLCLFVLTHGTKSVSFRAPFPCYWMLASVSMSVKEAYVKESCHSSHWILSHSPTPRKKRKKKKNIALCSPAGVFNHSKCSLEH